ncbi:Acetyl esterase/lipase [Halopseudomonas sabulinigri]|uniref:Acetyl esterase/lipase n=1 Tax=Halopseudomonas sabulinigri TaxID=472181 RepID=A0A1H1NTG4_9GAMM|nr:alpha/beta hydrolase [Halopseudomonas sabulinigri]SDS01659.1 Acetyl esterase/lipase [Halopseudomonas sabulinigri]
MPLLRTLSLLMTTLLSGCSALAPVNWLVPNHGYEKLGSLRYGDLPRQQMDVYLPAELKPNAPVVVFYYGGSWRSGERGNYRFVGQALASRGIIAVIPDYRLYPEVRYPDFLRDSAKALAWTRAHQADWQSPQGPLFVMGHSAGAYNAAMLALDSRWLDQEQLSPDILSGWIGLAGPYDFLPIINPDVQPVFYHPDTPVDSQPLVHASAASPPALLLAGAEDDLVDPQRNTRQLAEALTTQGVATKSAVMDDLGHIKILLTLAAPFQHWAPVIDQVTCFISQHGVSKTDDQANDGFSPPSSSACKDSKR